MKQTKDYKNWILRQGALLVLAGFAFITSLAISLQAQASPVVLRHNNVIEGAQITLGDIFSGLSTHEEDRILGAAPRPGDDMVLNARTLLRIALATGIEWRPASNADYIVLSSAATLVDHDTIKDKLKSSLRDRGIQGTFDVMFSNDSRSEIVLPRDVEKNVAVQSITLNRNRDWFDAVLVAPSLDNPIQRVNISGRIETIISLPVLNTNLRKGDVISAVDITQIDVPARNVTHDMLLDKKDIIGMTPNRLIVQGKPISTNDLRPPLMVERGGDVTMIFDNNGLRLTAMGRALQNGSKGDVIRVMNAASSRTVEAIISGEKEVTVRTF